MNQASEKPNMSKSSSERVSVRWVTWWPTPYWIDRFNYLASREDVEFEGIFLSERSSILSVEVSKTAYGFSHIFLSRRTDSAGYYSDFKVRLPRPWPLIHGHPDAIIIPYSEASCITAAILCWVLRKPHFLFAPNTKYDERKPSRFRDWLKRRLFENATGILVTGPLQRNYTFQYAKDDSRISIVGNPIGSLEAGRYGSPEIRDKLRHRFGWENDNVMLYVGRLAPEKGLLTLMDSLSKVLTEIRPRLVLIGSGPLEPRLRARAASLGLEVQFAGFLQREDLAQRYAAADVFVLPSQSEPWGLVVNEAMEFGLPLILSSKVGCAPVLLREGLNGLAFAAGDSGALAACVEQLSSDESLRRRMGLASKRIIRDHSVEHWADAVLSAIRKSASQQRDRMRA